MTNNSEKTKGKLEQKVHTGSVQDEFLSRLPEKSGFFFPPLAKPTPTENYS